MQDWDVFFIGGRWQPSATDDRVEVVLFVDQSVSNAAAPAPQLDRSRVKMTMDKVDGRWLASKVELP